MNNVNIALQVLPSGKDKKEIYNYVDAAIAIIKKSGLKYEVCPFETVIEGTYDSVMKVVDDAQQACFDAGAKDLIVYVKIQRSRDNNVSIEDKMQLYR